MMLFVLLATQVAFAANPAPVQIFYVPIDEDEGLASLREISTNSVAPVYSYISISIGTDGTLVYYDQWENGFFNDMANIDIYATPGNTDGTQIWGNGEADDGCPPNKGGGPIACNDGNDTLAAGNVIVLNSTVSDLTGPTARMVIDFDGGDKIGATEQVAVSRIYWAAGSQTLSAGSSEVYPTNDWGTSYQVPVGEDYSYVIPSGGPVTQVGTATQASASTSGTGLTIPKPAGVAVGDLLIAVVAWRDNGLTMAALPSGWTELTEAGVGGTGDDISQRVFWKRAVAGDVGATDYTFSTTANTSQRLGSITAYSNAGNPTTPGGSDTGTGTSNNAPAVNYPNDSWVMHAGALREGSSRSGPTGSTEQIDFNTGAGGTNMTLATARTAFTTPGTTTNNSATWGVSGKWIATHVVIPVAGTTVTHSDLNNMFEYTAISVQASVNGTSVSVDQDGVGPLAPINFILNEGQSNIVTPIYQGATVTSDFPVQVDLLGGDPGDEYEYSAYTMIPTAKWGNSYWSPVSGQLNGGADGAADTFQTQFLVYNPTGAAINVRCDFQGAGSDSTQSVPAGGLATWAVPANSGAHCFTVTTPGGSTQDPNGPAFFTISTVDAENITGNSGSGSGYDWGLTPIPDGFLDTQALVGLGLGRDPNAGGTQNGSPVWVTPACIAPATNTYVYVDWNGDGIPDDADLNGDNDTGDTVNGVVEADVNQGVLLPLLQSIRFFDPTDFNQTGAQIWSRTGANNTGDPGCNIVVAWGEDPGPASIGSPGFDVGTTVPPLVSLSAAKLVKDTDGDAFVTPGDTLLYTVTVKNTSKFGSFTSVAVSDTIPAGTTYVPGSTFKNIGGGPVVVPDGPPGTVFPLDEGGIVVGGPLLPLQTWTVSFKVTVNEVISCDANIQNTAFVIGNRGVTQIRREATVISSVDCPASLVIEKVATGPDTPPGFDFTLVSSATLPPGILPGSTILTPPAPNSSIAQTISVPAGVYTVTEGLETNWTLASIVCTPAGSPGGTAQLGQRRARYVLPEAGTVKCTWTNTRNAGIIRVQKDVVPDAPSTQWTMTGSGGPTAWNGTINGDGFFTRTVATGVYGITESGPDLANYNTTWSCSAVNPSQGPLNGSGLVISGINVVQGQTWTCTYTNTRKAGTLTIQKVGIGANGTFTYATTGGLPNPITINTTGYVQGVSNSSGGQTFNNLATGNYSVVESGPPVGWDFTSLSCSGGGGNTSTSGQTATIGLDEGENIVCTYTNTRRGSLEVTKVIDWNGLPVDPTQKFTITVTGPSYPTGNTRTYGGGDPLTFLYTNLLPGSYTVVETAPTAAQGWQVTVTPGNPQVQPGQQASVTVTNKRNQGTLLISKAVHPTFTRRFDWQINKVVTPTTVHLFDGQTGTLTYTVRVTKSAPIDEAFRITGTVTILNNGVTPAVINSVVDKLDTGATVPLTCPGLPGTIAGGAQVVCTYDYLTGGQLSTTNRVTVTTNINTVYTGTAPVAFGQPTTTIRDSINVSDTNGPGGAFNTTNAFNYTRPVDCSTATGYVNGVATFPRNNTAEIVQTGQEDSASSTINCYRLTVTKSAETSLTRTWDWDIYKVVTPTSLTLLEDQSAVLTYTVGVTKLASTDSNWAANGVIIVANPAPIPAPLSSLTDNLMNGSTVVASALPNCASGTTVPANGSINCTYSTSLPSGATLSNRAVAVLAGKSYTGTAPVSFSPPTTVTRVNDTIHVTDTYTTTVWPFSVSGDVNYDRPADCVNAQYGLNGQANYVITNTAQITETLDQASVNVPVTCIRYGEIRVQKVTVPANTAGSFTFYGDLNGAIGHGQQITRTVIPGQIYHVTETVPAGWTLTSIGCEEREPNSGWVGATAAFDVQGGETVTCTYTNTKGLARIYITPPTATNEVNDAHDFTATVETSIDNGATWQPVNSQVVTGTIVAGVGTPTTQTCTTNGAGQCVLTINSSVAGTSELQAQAMVDVLGLDTLVTTSGSTGQFRNALKTWVDAAIQLTPLTAWNKVGDSHTVTATVITTDGVTGGLAPDGTVVTFTVNGGPYSNAIFTDTTVGGQASVTINSAVGAVITIDARTNVVVGGLTLTRQTGTSVGSSPDATKTYVNLRVRIDPQNDTNPLNLQHTFTVSITQDLGNGVWVPVADGVTATVTIAPQPLGFSLVSDTCATPGTVGGQCTVVINSSVAQVYTANASVTTSVSGQSITRSTLNDPANIAAGGSGPATKTYREGALDVTKTVEPSYTRTYSWTVEKVVDPDRLDLFEGQSAPVTYTVQVTKDAGTNSAFQIQGTITFSNTSVDPVIVNQPVDALADGTSIALNCATTPTPNVFPYTIPGSGQLVCTYIKTFPATQDPNSLDTTNHVTVTTTSGSTFTGTAAVNFGEPTLKINDAISVTDTNTGTLGTGVTSSSTFTYSLGLSCETQQMFDETELTRFGTKDNTAAIRNGSTVLDSDDATVDVGCYRLQVEKDAAPTLTRTWTWEINKVVSPTVVDLFEDQTAPLSYTVQVTKSQPVDSAWAATGKITVTNPAPMAANLTSVTDSLPGSSPIVTCGTNVVPAGGALTCTYAATGLPNGNTVTNTAVAVLAGNNYTGTATVDFANATVTPVNPTITITDTNLPTTTWNAGATTSFTYTLPATCSNIDYVAGTGSKTLPNLAQITQTGQNDDASVLVNCTQYATIVVEKITVPAGYPQQFAFTGDLNGSIGHGQQISRTVVPGTYAVTETVPAGWYLTDISCDDANSTDSGTSATYNAEAGETVTCTFTNTRGLARIYITPPTATNEVNDAHDFTATVETSIDNGATWQPVASQVVTGTIVAGVGTPTTQTCTTNGAGQCVLTINSSVAGTSELQAQAMVDVLGLDTLVTTSGSTGQFRNALKTWVDAAIQLTPLQAINAVGDPHVFTATVSTNNGGVAGVAPDGTVVTFTVNGGPYSNAIFTDTTVGGQATVTINSNAATVITIHAETDVVVGGVTLHRETDGTGGNSGDATKTYVSGQIIVEKQTLPNGSTQVFQFTASYTNPFGLSDGQSKNSGELQPGTYSVTETVPAGWDLTGVTCTDGSDPDAINLAAGEVVRCIFNNTQRGVIIVEKQTDPNGDPTLFAFNGALVGSISDGQQITKEVAPGTHQVTETVPAGWDLVNITCDNTASTHSGATANYVVAAGETVKCTFYNQADARIVVVKQTIPDGSTQSFEFDPSWGANFFLMDGQSNNSGDLDPGTYSVSEIVPSGWNLTSTSCTDQSPVSAISLQASETITCTFTNTRGQARIYFTPPTATNAVNVPHIFTATVEVSADNGATWQPVVGQVVTGTIVPVSVGTLTPPGTCVTNASGKCGLQITSAQAGITTLNARALVNVLGLPTLVQTSGTSGQFRNAEKTWVDLRIGITPQSETNGVNEAHLFTVLVERKIGNGAWTPVQGANPVISYPGGAPATAPTACTAATGADGKCTFTINSPTAGVFTVKAAVTTSVSGQNITRETSTAANTAAGGTANATKTYVSGRIIVVKQTQPDGSPQQFEFNPSWSQANFFLSDGGSHNSGELAPGSYSVSELTPTGWDLASAICSDQSQPGAISLAANETVTCTFTNVQRQGIIVEKVTIPAGSTQKFDFTTNFSQPFTLTGAAPNNVWQSGLLAPGQYSIDEVTPAGWELTDVSCEDIVEEPFSGAGAPQGDVTVNLTAGASVRCVFTNTLLASLGDRVWEDVDPNATTTPGYLAGDGLQNDPAEQGVPGITVELWSPGGDGVIGGGDDSLVATTVTAPDGKYFFDDVTPGEYYLVFTNPTGTGAWSTNFQVGSDPTIDSDVEVDLVDPTKARTDLLTLGAGENDLTWDAAIVTTLGTGSSDLGDFVWNDVNRNGIQDPGEAGIPNLLVQLFQVATGTGVGVSDTLIATDTTDANGIYGFLGLDPATYYVVVQIPNGYSVSPQFSGSNPAVDSNIDSTGRSANVVLPEFTSNLTIDAGVFETPTADPIPDEPGAKRLYLPTVIK